MGKIIIGFSTPKKKKILSEVISFFDKENENAEKKMTHSYTRFIGKAWERDFIYQASGLATNFAGSKHFEDINLVVEEYEIPVEDMAETRVGQICVDREGKSYGVKQLFGNAAVVIVKLVTFGKVKIKNPLKDGENSVTCLEEMGWVLAQATGTEVPENLEEMGVWEWRNFVAGLPNSKRSR